MKRLIIWMIAGSVVILLFIGFGIWFFQKEMKEDDPEYVLHLIKEKVSSKHIAVSINHNGKKLANINEDESLPLASTMKIIVAIEYARQAAEGKIDPDQQVSLKELETYYFPKTDGGAHEAWIKQLKEENNEDISKVKISDIADGMIAFSSNANTDYLMQLLGLDRINQLLEELDLSSHEPLYPISGAMFVPVQLMEEEGLSKKEALKALKNMSLDDYRERAVNIEKEWQTAPPTEQMKKQLNSTLDMKFQKIWSDRLPRSTTKEYVSLMEKLNSKKYFPEKVHHYLDPVLEQLMKNPYNKEWLKHAGEKGGSTAFVLTVAMYAEDKEGNRTEIAFFADDLSQWEQLKLQQKMNSFQLKLLTDPSFRKRISNERILLKP